MLIIKNTQLKGRNVDILIEKGKIKKIDAPQKISTKDNVEIIDGINTAVFPTFVNGHTHSPMVLLRGYGDDMPLEPWLKERIWPVEAAYSEKDFEIGYRLAFIEMIAGGTTAINEMYLHPEIALKVLHDIPIKGNISFPIIDGCNESIGKKQIEACREFFKTVETPKGVTLGVASHSVYATSEYSLKCVRDFAEEKDTLIHIHLSETEKEVSDCMKLHKGLSPVKYLDSIGFLSERVTAAHAVWLTDEDIDILAKRGVTVIHNPTSNMKLATGKAFPYTELKERGVQIMLGTDGASSNNNLDMLEEMKIAALLQKHEYSDPTRLTAEEAFLIATRNGAEKLKTGGGIIKEGLEADLMLIDLNTPEMIPATNIISNLVYSATRACIKTVICSGQVLMKDSLILGAEECYKEAIACTKNLLLRKSSG